MSLSLPESWAVQPLSSVADSVRKTASISAESKYELWSVPSFSDGHPEVVNGSSVGSGKLMTQPGDVLISKINPRINRVWIVCESPERLPQICSTEWLVARPKSKGLIVAPYLAFYMSSPLVRESIASMTKGVTGSHTRANGKQMMDLDVPVPPLAEQEKIVEILEEQLARLDAAVKSVQTVRERAAQFRRSLLHAAFTGSSTHRSLQSSSWKSVGLADVLDSSIGGIWGEEPGVSEVEVRVLRVTELKSHGRIDSSTAARRSITQKQLESRQLRPGDLLLEKSGGGPTSPVGRVGLVKTIEEQSVCSNFMQLLRPDPTRISSRFLHLYLNLFHENGGTISMQTATTNIRNIKTSEYLKTEVLVPSISEQEEIVAYLEEQISRLDSTLAVADEIERKATALRRSLLHAAFSGELTRSWREANV
jgi:type I restriction enzyme S subunit